MGTFVLFGDILQYYFRLSEHTGLEAAQPREKLRTRMNDENRPLSTTL